MLTSIHRASDLLSSPIANRLKGSTDEAGTATGGAKVKLNSRERIVNFLWGAGVISDRHVSADIRSANVSAEMSLHSHLSATYGEAATRLAFLDNGRSANGFNVEGRPICERQAKRIEKLAAAHHDYLKDGLTAEQKKSARNWRAFSAGPGRTNVTSTLGTKLGYKPSDKLVDAVMADISVFMDQQIRASSDEMKALEFLGFMDPVLSKRADAEAEHNLEAIRLSSSLMGFARSAFDGVTSDMDLFAHDLVKHMYLSGGVMSEDVFSPVTPEQRAGGKKEGDVSYFGRGAKACVFELDDLRRSVGAGTTEPEAVVERIFQVHQACDALEKTRPTTVAGQHLVKALRAQADLLFYEVTKPLPAPTAAAS